MTITQDVFEGDQSARLMLDDMIFGLYPNGESNTSNKTTSSVPPPSRFPLFRLPLLPGSHTIQIFRLSTLLGGTRLTVHVLCSNQYPTFQTLARNSSSEHQRLDAQGSIIHPQKLNFDLMDTCGRHVSITSRKDTQAVN